MEYFEIIKDLYFIVVTQGKILETHPKYSQYKISTHLTTDGVSKGW